MIIKNKHFQIVLFISFLMIITACQGTKNTVDNTSVYQNTETDLVKMIESRVSEEYNIKEKINVSEIAYYDNDDGFLVFSFKDPKDTLYEGVAYANIREGKWKIIELEATPTDKEVPFTNHTLTTNSGKKFYISSGYINDKEISEIRISYSNDLQKIIKIGDDQNLYLDYEFGDDIYKTEIVGLNKDGDIIHQYKFSAK